LSLRFTVICVFEGPRSLWFLNLGLRNARLHYSLSNFFNPSGHVQPRTNKRKWTLGTCNEIGCCTSSEFTTITRFVGLIAGFMKIILFEMWRHVCIIIWEGDFYFHLQGSQLVFYLLDSQYHNLGLISNLMH